MQEKGQDDPDQEKLDVLRDAAKLIRSDVKLIETSNKYYPIIETDVSKHVEF